MIADDYIDLDPGGRLRKSVKRGIKALDQMIPKWTLLIDLDKLRMSSCYSCILGQVLGDFHNEPMRVALGIKCNDDAADHGFNLPDDMLRSPDIFESFHKLGRIWKEEILYSRPVQ